MAIFAKHKDVKFGVGDTVRVSQEIREGEKTRIQVFEGIVIKIKGRQMGKTFTVRRVGSQQVGIEKIFPLATPVVVGVEVVKKGTRGIRRSKLYYIRDKSRKEINKIFSRANKKEESKRKASLTAFKKTHKKLIKKTKTAKPSLKKTSKKK